MYVEGANNCDLKFYKMSPDTPTPVWGTNGSTCFDLTFAPVGDVVSGYDENNTPIKRFLPKDSRELTIYPGERLLVPTGLIFKIDVPLSDLHIPRTYSIRLHARSGMALKRGLILANSEGVVDIDYQEQVYALMVNTSKVVQKIQLHERICQAEVVKNEAISLQEVSSRPEPFMNRTGGFGSTGS
jgi:dUTP pyrophosphatase